MSYGTDVVGIWRQVGAYTGRILKGSNPAHLPVARSTRFIFALNMKTAKVLDIKVLPIIRAQADIVVE